MACHMTFEMRVSFEFFIADVTFKRLEILMDLSDVPLQFANFLELPSAFFADIPVHVNQLKFQMESCLEMEGI